MYYGIAWYPESWPEERWPEDIEWMRKARFNVVRLAEYAWRKLETSEGKFDFDWLDRAIDLAQNAGMKVILGTPSAAPPNWLCNNYPEALCTDESGRPPARGSGGKGRPLSPQYQKFCVRIAGEMGRRYGSHPAVIGWQIDNEYNRARLSWDPETRRQFQRWLKEKYGSLQEFNLGLNGHPLPRDYEDWGDIPFTPRPANSRLRQEISHFHTYAFKTYQKVQLDVLRSKVESWQWISNNLIAWQGIFDAAEVSRDLDFVSWDSYWPTYKFSASPVPDPVMEALGHDLYRGFKRRNFWLLETQVPSAADWAQANPQLDPGVVRLRNWQAVAHGCEGLLYWMVRHALAGGGEMHGSLLGADGKPRPGFEEVARLGEEFERLSPLLEVMPPVRSSVALLHSFEARWAIEAQPHHADYDYVHHLLDHYRPFFKRGLAVEVLDAGEALEDFKLVVVPALWVLNARTAAELKAFTEAGGHLVLTTRCGARGQDLSFFQSLPPGPLAGLAGVEVEDVYPLLKPVKVKGTRGSRIAGTAKIWGERLALRAADVEVLARFEPEGGWLDGMPAVTTRAVGKGRVTCLAGWFEEKLLDQTLQAALDLSGISSPVKKREAGVELVQRSGRQGNGLTFVLNHNAKAVRIKAPGKVELITRQAVRGSFLLPARGVAIFRNGPSA